MSDSIMNAAVEVATTEVVKKSIVVAAGATVRAVGTTAANVAANSPLATGIAVGAAGVAAVGGVGYGAYKLGAKAVKYFKNKKK